MRSVFAPSKLLGAGLTSELALEPRQIVDDLVDQLRLDRVLDDRVAVARDPRRVLGHRGRVESCCHRRAP